MKKTVSPDKFGTAFVEAANLLKAYDFSAFCLKIADMIVLDVDAPQPHNLLGIAYEIKGEESLARKHYRAAYALDPTYKPACRNLERLSLYGWNSDYQKFDYGIEP